MADIDAFVRAEVDSLVADQDPARLGPLFNREGGCGPERALSDALGAAAYTLEELARPEVVAALRAWRG